MNDRAVQIERAQNLWASFERKYAPLARSTTLIADPSFDVDRIGGLAAAKDEILTYACAATSPGVYHHWGTFPPSGILLIGQLGVGKSLLARALATRTGTSFLQLDVPRLVLDMVHSGGKLSELIPAWSQILEEMPPLTAFFHELEFSQTRQIGTRRVDLPIGPIMDFLLEIVDRTNAAGNHLLVGSTSHPDTLRQAFLETGRFERVVEVTPIFPDDVIAVLRLHAVWAEGRAERTLFEDIDWPAVIGQTRSASPGDWVRILHAVLRRKARCESSGEDVGLVTTEELKNEVDRFKQALKKIRTGTVGHYL